MNFLSETVVEALGGAQLVSEGLGKCPKHGCDYSGTDRPVVAYDYDPNNSKRVIGSHLFQPKLCEECWKEAHDDDGMPVEKQVVEAHDYLADFRRKKGIDLEKDVIVMFSYGDELSVTAVENMKAWIFENIKDQLRIKVLNVNKYIEQRKNRFTNAETKEKFTRLTYEIETADLLIIDSIADYSDNDVENFYWPMLVAKESASFMVLSIPESESRFDDLPIKLKYRMKNAQRMNLTKV